MKNTVLMVIVLIFVVAGLVIASGALGDWTPTADRVTKKDINITVDAQGKTSTSTTAIDANKFTGLTYTITGNQITLNKEGVFNGKTVEILGEQKCTDYRDKTCLEYSTPECMLWEERPEPTCLKEEDKLCLEWEAPKGCKEFDSKTVECLAWEAEAKCVGMSTPVCIKEQHEGCYVFTNYTRDDFIKQTIIKELETFTLKKTERDSRTTPTKDFEGVVTIEKK